MRSIDIYDFRFEFKVKISGTGTGGPQIYFTDDRGWGMKIWYYGEKEQFILTYGRDTEWHLGSAIVLINISLVNDNWYEGAIEWRRTEHLIFEFNGETALDSYDYRTSFKNLGLLSDVIGECCYDDIVLRTAYIEGSGTSHEVTLPDGASWNSFQMGMEIPDKAYVRIDLLDASTMDPLKGYYDLNTSTISLVGIDPYYHDSIMVRARMIAFNFNVPAVDWWNITWKEGWNGYIEPMDDTSRIFPAGGTEIQEGKLRTSNVFYKDEFTKIDFNGWTLHEGRAQIRDGYIWMRTDTSNSEAQLETTVGTYSKVRFQVSTYIESPSSGEVPKIILMEGPDHYIEFYYHSGRQRFEVGWYDRGSSKALGSYTAPQPPQDQWMDMVLEYDGEYVTASYGNVQFTTQYGQIDTFNGIGLSSSGYNDVRYDEVIVSVPSRSGQAISGKISLPEGKMWDSFDVSTNVDDGASLQVSILDSTTNEALDGFDDIIGHENLRDVHPLEISSITIQFQLSGAYRDVASVDWFLVTWTEMEDEIQVVSEFPEIKMMEDSPRTDILDVRDHIRSNLISANDLRYEIVNVTPSGHIEPYLLGFLVGIDLPIKNWYGNASFRIRCSSSWSSYISPSIKVIVGSVDDPPDMQDPGLQTVNEDEPTKLELTPFLTDVDTPISRLTVDTDSGACTVEHLNLTILFHQGNETKTILLVVGDGTSNVTKTITVFVREVNDPPFIDEIPIQYIAEEAYHDLDLFPYIWDEESHISAISIGSNHPAIVSITGTVVSMMFPKETMDLDIDIWASDGISTSHQTIPVEIIWKNDDPILRAIGEWETPVVMRVPEGVETFWQIHAEDEESSELTYRIESAWRGISVFDNGTVRISAADSQVGEYHGNLRITDADGGFSLNELSIVVYNVNDAPFPPVIIEPLNHTAVIYGTNVTFTVDVYDPDHQYGDVISVSWVSNISGLIYTMEGMDELSFSSSNLAIGTHRISVIVTDGEIEATSWFEISVKEPRTSSGSPSDNNWMLVGLVGGLVAMVLGFIIMVRIRKGGARDNPNGPIVDERDERAGGREMSEDIHPNHRSDKGW